MRELASRIVDIINNTTNDYDAIEEVEAFLTEWTLNNEGEKK